MTEQEAEVFAQRLRRVWSPQSEFTIRRRKQNRYFAARLAAGVRVEHAVFAEYSLYSLIEVESDLEFLSFSVFPDGLEGVFGFIFVEGTDAEWIQALRDDWLPAFRRNCWLSGAAIEASAHEKAEWMRGFTEEEVEEWGLTM